MRLVSSGGAAVTLSLTSSPSLDVDVGDVVRMTSDGPCAAALNLAEQSGFKLSPVKDQTAVALKTGSTKVAVAHGMCAQLTSPQPDCYGGIVPDGHATVVIHSR